MVISSWKIMCHGYVSHLDNFMILATKMYDPSTHDTRKIQILANFNRQV